MAYKSEVFGARAFVAAPLSSKEVRACILNKLKTTAQYAEKQLNGVVATWNHDVDFTKPIIRYSGGDAYISISTDDDAFFYLDEGTVIRWAHMTDNFVPKTSRRSFRSSKGVGGVRRIGPPPIFPGIEPREWTVALAEEIEDILSTEIDACINAYFR